MGDDDRYKVTLTEKVVYKGVFRKSTEYRSKVEIEGDGDELSKIAVAWDTALSDRNVDSFKR